MLVPRERLGRTGLDVSRLGYGSMGLRGPKTWGVRVVSEQAADELLNAVLDAGINFIDTAPRNAAARPSSMTITWRSPTYGNRKSSGATSSPAWIDCAPTTWTSCNSTAAMPKRCSAKA